MRRPRCTAKKEKEGKQHHPRGGGGGKTAPPKRMRGGSTPTPKEGRQGQPSTFLFEIICFSVEIVSISHISLFNFISSVFLLKFTLIVDDNDTTLHGVHTDSVNFSPES